MVATGPVVNAWAILFARVVLPEPAGPSIEIVVVCGDFRSLLLMRSSISSSEGFFICEVGASESSRIQRLR